MKIQVLRWLLAALALLCAQETIAATPAGCVAGYQDATCFTRIVSGTIPPPTCPSGAGYTTASPAQWKGSYYSAPQCNYEAPPSCPSEFVETAAPYWTASGWAGLTCFPSAPQPPSGAVTAVTATPDPVTFNAGQTVTITATTSPAEAGITVSFSQQCTIAWCGTLSSVTATTNSAGQASVTFRTPTGMADINDPGWNIYAQAQTGSAPHVLVWESTTGPSAGGH